MDCSVDNPNGKYYVVCECGECFENERKLMMHFAKLHPTWSVEAETAGKDETDPEYVAVKSKKTKKKIYDNDKGKYVLPKNKVCEYCGRKFISNGALTNHQRVHTGEKPFSCSMCSKSFAMMEFLQIHTRIHTGEKPYVCSVCNKRFNNKTALNRHTKVHTGEKPYACPQCNKAFSQSNSMKLHVMTVHLKMPAPYKDKRHTKIKRLKQNQGGRETNCEQNGEIMEDSDETYL